jgi:hypothetical protein
MHLNGCNDWENWQVQFEALARSENVWNIVTGSANAKPMPEEPTPPEINTSPVTYGMAIRPQTVSETSEHTGPITQSPIYVDYGPAREPSRTLNRINRFAIRLIRSRMRPTISKTETSIALF